MDFICVSLMATDNVHFFHMLIGNLYTLEKMSIHIFIPYFSCVVFFIIKLEKFLIYSRYKSHIKNSICKYFHSFVGFLFTSLMVYLETQFLIKSSLYVVAYVFDSYLRIY